MDKLGRRDRWHKPYKRYQPATEAELKLALALVGHTRRRPGIATRFLGALVGRKKKHTQILPELQAAKIITYHKSVKDHHNARYRDMEWMPTKRGNRWYEHRIGSHPELTYEPQRGLNSWYAHASTCSLIGASFDLAPLEFSGVSIGYYEYTPQNYDGLIPDEPPFWLSCEYKIDIAGLEYDRGTMSLNDFAAKLRKYNLYFINRHYERHGLQTAYVLIVSNSAWRTERLRELVASIIEPRLQDRFLFKTIPDFKDHEIPPATGFIISEPWLTVDGGSFNMLEVLGWTSSNSKNSSTCARKSTKASASW